MPTLFRLLAILVVIGAAVFGAMFVLANFIEPSPREMTITIPQERLKGK